MIQYLLVTTDTGQAKSQETDHVIVKTLKETYEQARVESNIRLQETVALTIGQLGRWVLLALTANQIDVWVNIDDDCCVAQ